jgi:hypothetical protein
VVRNGRLEKLPVTTGINDGRYVEVTSGLTSKDLVVQTFSPALVPGEEVKVNAVSAVKRAIVTAE